MGLERLFSSEYSQLCGVILDIFYPISPAPEFWHVMQARYRCIIIGNATVALLFRLFPNDIYVQRNILFFWEHHSVPCRTQVRHARKRGGKSMFCVSYSLVTVELTIVLQVYVTPDCQNYCFFQHCNKNCDFRSIWRVIIDPFGPHCAYF